MLSYTLKSLIEESTTSWENAEWGIPKGRRNYQERDLQCGLREFEEETGYLKMNVQIIQNLDAHDQALISADNCSILFFASISSFFFIFIN